MEARDRSSTTTRDEDEDERAGFMEAQATHKAIPPHPNPSPQRRGEKPCVLGRFGAQGDRERL